MCFSKPVRKKYIFGYTVQKAFLIASCATCVFAFLFILESVIILGLQDSKILYGRDPNKAVDLIMALVFIPMSIYQLLLSGALLWQYVKTDGVMFIMRSWFLSHLSIVFVYTILFLVKCIVCVGTKRYLLALVSAVVWILWEASFTLILIVVHTYMNSLNIDMYI